MSLDIILTKVMPTEVYGCNITHNLNKMAEELGIYKYLWRPEEIGVKKASELIKPLRIAIKKMLKDPDYYSKFNASNDWGTYENFLPFLEELLLACEEFPDADISVSR